MAYTTVLDKIPTKLTAGESVSWSVSLSDYPASDSWVLTYTLIKSDTRIQIVAAASDDDHLVEVTAATTADYAVGTYDFQAHITNGTEKYQVDAGVIEIVTDFATQASGFDSRSHAKIVLDALESAIEGRASKTQMSQMVGSVQVQHMTIKEQLEIRDIYAARYRRELVTSGAIKSRRTIKTRFV
jgi:hypothetical protein